MDILGFIATIIICITVVISIALFLKHPIRFKITRENISNTPEKLETQENVSAQEIEQPEIVCMDAVVQAANELMGIQTFKKEDKE